MNRMYCLVDQAQSIVRASQFGTNSMVHNAVVAFCRLHPAAMAVLMYSLGLLQSGNA